ncbi:hypothetical protein GvMRE_Ic1g71 [endosymbiont GvMRE of Glomus versiforme]|nr:hypothetical protein GvMRE_Ic1g71 [endosymbiont GvMRE of Glomus versiforme]
MNRVINSHSACEPTRCEGLKNMLNQAINKEAKNA